MILSDASPFDARRLALGLAAIAFFMAYALQQVRLQKAENTLWACHLGCALVGLGWLFRSPRTNALGLLWLLPGIFFWMIYLLDGGAFKWSSCLTHVGGNTLGLLGAAVLGFPTGTWWAAGLGYTFLVLLSRRVSRASENVNFAIHVWPGWEERFPSHRRYVIGLVLGGFVLFLALELLLQRFFADAG